MTTMIRSHQVLVKAPLLIDEQVAGGAQNKAEEPDTVL